MPHKVSLPLLLGVDGHLFDAVSGASSACARGEGAPMALRGEGGPQAPRGEGGPWAPRGDGGLWARGDGGSSSPWAQPRGVACGVCGVDGAPMAKLMPLADAAVGVAAGEGTVLAQELASAFIAVGELSPAAWQGDTPPGLTCLACMAKKSRMCMHRGSSSSRADWPAAGCELLQPMRKSPDWR
mmetsp:Transcript_13789/g.31264  ORF Transcript_13789/g.31264 Transcript_13789/m.31264 type:complete len:184 (+) Transcript_13789:103-654(+)